MSQESASYRVCVCARRPRRTDAGIAPLRRGGPTTGCGMQAQTSRAAGTVDSAQRPFSTTARRPSEAQANGSMIPEAPHFALSHRQDYPVCAQAGGYRLRGARRHDQLHDFLRTSGHGKHQHPVDPRHPAGLHAPGTGFRQPGGGSLGLAGSPFRKILSRSRARSCIGSGTDTADSSAFV